MSVRFAEAMPAPEAYGFTLIVVATGAMVQSVTGLGFGLIVAPVLLALDPDFVPGAVILTGILVAAASALRDRAAVDRGFLLAGIAGRIPGALIAAALIASVSEASYRIWFAGAIFVAVLLSVKGPRFQPTLPVIAAAGLVSGVMGTLTGAGAPPLALALQHAPPSVIRATMNALLLIGACISLTALIAWGAFGWSDVVHAVLLLPGAAVGFVVSRRMVHRPEVTHWLRPLTLILCLTVSAVLAVQALRVLLA